MKRRIFGFVMAVSLLLGAMPGMGLTAYAQETSASGDIHRDTPGNAGTADGWAYEDVGDGTLRITDYEGEEAELVVPAQIGEQTVTQIGDGALAGKQGIYSVSVSEGITAIGDTAFTGCTSLIAVYAPAGGTTEAWCAQANIPFVGE